jgi:hypothetical protein
MFRVNSDGQIETDSLDEALELQRRLRGGKAVVTVRAVKKTKALPRMAKTKDGVVYDSGLMGEVGEHNNLGPGVTIKEDSVGILLKAAGYKRIYKETRRLYGFFLRYPKTVWRASEIVKRVPAKTGNRHTTWSHLNRLVKRQLIKQVARGQYQLG